MVEKVGFTNCVFEKLCFFSENTIFLVFSANHSFSKTKLYVEKNRKFMKNCGLFLNMAKWCFLGLFFWGFNIEKVCFWCVWHCFKSVKNACFLKFFGAFLGWLIVVHLGLEGLGVFVFLVFVFLFLCCFCFCFVCFVIGFVVGLFWVLVLLFLCFCFCCFFGVFVFFRIVCFSWRV